MGVLIKIEEVVEGVFDPIPREPDSSIASER
jgi:hypothetical protein